MQEELNQQFTLSQDTSNKLAMINTNSTNNTENCDPKTANSETDYTSLFRGLSTLEFDSYNSLIEHKQDPSNIDSESANNIANSEKTFTDLSDLLLREQTLNSTNNIKQDIISSTDSKDKVITELNTVLLTNNNQQLPNMSLNDSLMSAEESQDTNASFSSGYDSFMAKDSLSGRIQLKRLSAASSMASTSGLVDPSKKPKRGRKPSSLSDGSKIKLTKKQLEMKESEKPLVCFGNKAVEIGTEEYVKRRASNNVAVKKCREKLNEKQKEREERMSNLNEENKKLTGTVETLYKELNVLKNIIIQMSPGKKLPEHIQTMFKSLNNQ